MCGIFGAIHGESAKVRKLAKLSLSRGRDASGIALFDSGYRVRTTSGPITKLLRHIKASPVIIGHTRLATNGMQDNQPVMANGQIVVHNGIITNVDDLCDYFGLERQFEIDTEVLALIDPKTAVDNCIGTVNMARINTKRGILTLSSNNGSLYYGYQGQSMYFASEQHYLHRIGCFDINQISNDAVNFKVESGEITQIIDSEPVDNLLPSLTKHAENEAMLQYRTHELKRCKRCILPETMPFISFNSDGICNYCTTYKPRNQPKPIGDLYRKLDRYRRAGRDCIVPFSGGRDSSYGLHYMIEELGLNPITYTYDWGMVTDLGRRNISMMCERLGVENIVVAADIRAKRDNIRKNLKAWLKSPHLGMVSILTAGDKHFFKYIDHVRANTGISLNIWSINPLEVTHFKSGFLGVEPVESSNVYLSGWSKQIDYQTKRFRAMLQSLGYFNSSLVDTLSGEYYRSVNVKQDYIQLYDYVRWDEDLINKTLTQRYDWERATDTESTWRIGDATAPFYNYIYYTVAGFTEHDTFLSNQIREGDITRDEAIKRAEMHNRPRYENIKWYLDAIGMDYADTIRTINSIPSFY